MATCSTRTSTASPSTSPSQGYEPPGRHSVPQHALGLTRTRRRQEDDGVLPAVLFSYDFSPITLTIEERRRPLLHVLTRICAVVGGVFAMFGMFSKLV
jgi:hypothetical protein